MENRTEMDALALKVHSLTEDQKCELLHAMANMTSLEVKHVLLEHMGKNQKLTQEARMLCECVGKFLGLEI